LSRLYNRGSSSSGKPGNGFHEEKGGGTAMNMLFRIRNEEKMVVARELESWKPAHDEAMLACDVAELVRDELASRDRDDRFLKRVLRRAAGSDKRQIDEANLFIQEYCSRCIRILELLQHLTDILGDAGHRIDGAAVLEKATDDYRKWKEDYPDLLAMAYTPLQEKIQSRLAAALEDKSDESDWEALFVDDKGSQPE
jgi:hypothetical protein